MCTSAATGAVDDVLRRRIRALGPITVASYMRESLSNQQSGYYMKRDVFGAAGDFITSPEISQVFGELLGVWFVNQWQQATKMRTSKQLDVLDVVELGPGRGTLMSDMLGVFNRIPQLKGRVNVHFVEMSPYLSGLQSRALRIPHQEGESHSFSGDLTSRITPEGVNVQWHSRYEDVPITGFPIVVAHEFLDALPVHQFQYTRMGWKERMITVDNNDNFVFTLAPAPTIWGPLYEPKGDFQIGDTYEVSPESLKVTKQIAESVKDDGCAMLVDYGSTKPKITPTLRGYKNHVLIEDFLDHPPGDIDLTADVDFQAISQATSSACATFGPQSQGEWLQKMGIHLRTQQMVRMCKTREEQVKVVQSCRRLTDPKGMGTLFQFLCLLPSNSANPFAFEGSRDTPLIGPYPVCLHNALLYIRVRDGCTSKHTLRTRAGMSMTARPAWRNDISCQLRRREEHHSQWALLIENYSKLLVQHSQLAAKAAEDTASLEKEREIIVRQERDLKRLKEDGMNVSSAQLKQKIAELEKKLESTRYELTESYKSKGTHAQKLLDLSELLQTRDEEIKKKNEELRTQIETIQRLNRTAEDQSSSLADKNTALQVLQDELQALQLELVTSTERSEKLQKENDALIERWLKKKNSEIALMNEANSAVESFRKDERVRRLSQLSEEKKIPRASSASHIGYTPEDPSWAYVDELGPPKSSTKTIQTTGEVNSIAFSTTGAMFATGTNDYRLTLWDTYSGQKKMELSGATQSVMAVSFSYKDDMVLAGSNDNATRLYDIRTQRLKHTLTGHISKVYTAKFNGDATRVVTGSHDRTIKIWDLVKGYCYRTMFTFSSCNDLVLTDESGTGVISGHVDNHIRFWDSRSGECTNELSGVHTGQITSLDMADDRNMLLTQSRDNTLKLIDLRMSQVVATMCGDGYKTPTNWSSACFSPLAKFVAAGSQDGSVFIWNASSSKMEAILKGHSAPVVACAWNWSSNILATGDKDKSVRIWHV
eukprot:CFRG5471T1